MDIGTPVSLVEFPFVQQFCWAELHLVDATLQERRTHKIAEQRMRTVGSRSELGMELCRHEPRVIRQLDDFHEATVGRHTAEDHPRVAERFAVLVVEFETMAVTLVDDLFALSLVRERTRHELAWIKAQ